MSAPSSPTELDILQRHWGHSGFRPMQAEIIRSVLQGHDTLGLLPTGGGKSVTFQVPALMLPGLTLVVTPLISLMKDQVDNLRRLDIGAVCLHSGMSRAESRLAIGKAYAGRAKLLYVSPEKLRSEYFLQQLRSMQVSLIVVDEAHCISQWGYDFRPSYLQIAELRRIFPHAPVLALTASATPEVVEDIAARLEFRPGHNTFRLSFDRSNLSYLVRHGDNKPERLLRILRATSGSAIVYVRSRRRTREIAELLTASRITADYYHAGLAPEEKPQRQQRWKDSVTRVMVATNAFGMGIDKPDVRVVVHYDLPSSLEEYYQEAGRAGRDGLPSFAVILASATDRATLSRRLADSFPPKDFIAEVYDRAGVFVDLALGEGLNQVFDFNFDLFCRQHSLRPALARAALGLLTRAGYVEFAEDADARARVMVTAHKDDLYSLQLSADEDAVLQYLLRNCSGLFTDFVNISEDTMAAGLGITRERVYQALLGLRRSGALSYVPRRENPYLFYPTRRMAARYVDLPRSVYEDMRRRMAERIDAMKRFVWSEGRCRAHVLLEYFGEHPAEPCGLCDHCRAAARTAAPAEAEVSALRTTILHVCSRPGGATVADVCTAATAPSHVVTAMIRSMVDSGLLSLDSITLRLTSLCKHH